MPPESLDAVAAEPLRAPGDLALELENIRELQPL